MEPMTHGIERWPAIARPWVHRVGRPEGGLGLGDVKGCEREHPRPPRPSDFGLSPGRPRTAISWPESLVLVMIAIWSSAWLLDNALWLTSDLALINPSIRGSGSGVLACVPYSFLTICQACNSYDQLSIDSFKAAPASDLNTPSMLVLLPA